MPGDPAGAGARGEGEGGPHQVPQRWQRGHSGKKGVEGRVGTPLGHKRSVVEPESPVPPDWELLCIPLSFPVLDPGPT